MFNKILKHAATIIYLNHSEYINSIVPRFNKRFAIIPNGCDKHNDIDIERPLNDPLKIVFIGRIAFNHKGLDILLEAITSMNNAHKKNVHFYFYGNEDDSGTELLKEMVDKLDIASYEGPIYGIEKEKLLRNTDIFILTSRYEGMPMGVLEAWSYGVPCILTEGTNMTGIDVNKYAYWKTNFDSKQIAATIKSAIKDLSANPQLYRIESIQEAQKYSWTNIASESIEVYKNRCKV